MIVVLPCDIAFIGFMQSICLNDVFQIQLLKQVIHEKICLSHLCKSNVQVSFATVQADQQLCFYYG